MIAESLDKNIKRIKKLLQLNRVKILFILSKRETCACELVEKLDIPNNLISHHLKVLTDLGILKSRKIGLHIKYSIRKSQRPKILKILKCLLSYEKNN
ncbi:helix-turn-helix transcriptional regulator [Candidatus Dojkabacteria bacterium]|nr:helix-turn-helix transcriptional regulator [Candidatus Dojkabacteria bacterium]